MEKQQPPQPQLQQAQLQQLEQQQEEVQQVDGNGLDSHRGGPSNEEKISEKNLMIAVRQVQGK